MDDDQVEKLCQAIKAAFRFQNADIFEHVLGGFKDEDGFAAGVHRIANALECIADKLGEDGGSDLDRIASNLGDIEHELERIASCVSFKSYAGART